MRIVCEKCAKQYRIDENRLAPGGSKFRCPACKHSFLVEPPVTLAAPATKAVPSKPLPPTLTGMGAPPPPPPPASPKQDLDFSLDELDLPTPRPQTVETRAVDILSIEDAVLSPSPSPPSLGKTMFGLGPPPPPQAKAEPPSLDDEFDLPPPRPTPPPAPLPAGFDEFDLPPPKTTGPIDSVAAPKPDDLLDWVPATSDRLPVVPKKPPASAPAAPAKPSTKPVDDLDLLFDEAGTTVPEPASIPVASPPLSSSPISHPLAPVPAPPPAPAPALDASLFDLAEPAPRLTDVGNLTPLELGDTALAPPLARPALSISSPSSIPVPRFSELDKLGQPSTPAKRRFSSKMLAYTAGGVMLFGFLLAGVLAHFYTEHGLFFWYWITKQPLAERTGARAILDQAEREAMHDAPESYARAITLTEEARKKAASYRKATGVRAQMRLAMLYRFGPDAEQAELAKADKTILSLFDPEDRVAIYEREKARALELLASGRAREAAGALENLERQGPQDAWRLTFQGWAYLRSRKPVEASLVLTRAVDLAPASDAALYALGLAELALGKIDSARSRFEAVLQRNPAHSSSALELAWLAWRAGDQASAKIQFAALLTQGGTPQRARALAILGKIAQAEAQDNEAQQRFEGALKLDPSNVEALTGLGLMLFQAGKPTEALAKCKAAQQFDPLDLDTRLCVIRTSLRLAKLQEARLEAEALLEQDPKRKEVLFLLGQISEGQEKDQEAIDHYKQALAAEPTFAAPYLHLARLYSKQKQTDLARATLAQAAALVGNRADIRSAVGELYLAEGQLKEAQGAFLEALELDPKLDAARFQLANLLLRGGRTAEAIEQFEKMRAQASNFPGLAEKLGLLYLARGERERAAQELDRALAAEGPSLDVRMAAVEAYLSVGRFEDARKQADIVGHELPQSAQAHYLLGLTLIELGKKTESIDELRQALSLERQGRFLFGLGRAYERAARAEEALGAYEEAVKLDRALVDAHIAAAHLRMSQGMYRASLQGLTEAQKQAPKRAEVPLLMGECSAQLGDREAALSSFDRAVRLDPDLAEARFKLGQALHNAGRTQQAIAHLQRAVALIKPESKPEWLSEVYVLLGYAYRDARQRALAIEAFKKYLEVLPDAPDRQDVLRELDYLGSGG